MDLSINYPYGIPFYSDQKFISINIINNEDHLFNIYFVENKEIKNLASIVFPHQKKKYQFPENSIVAIITDKKPNDIHCIIKLKDGWTYNYP
jgi:hypothetical protein